MILYHGTYTDFESIDLTRCMPYKDFGRGFYLTDIEQQTKDMALRKSKFVPNGKPYVLAYEFDEKFLTDGNLKVKVFENPTEEWAQLSLTIGIIRKTDRYMTMMWLLVR